MNALLLFKFELLPVLFFYNSFLALCLHNVDSHPTSLVSCPFVLQFVSLSSFRVPIVLQLIVKMFSNLIFGIPNNACIFTGTTEIAYFAFVIMF